MAGKLQLTILMIGAIALSACESIPYIGDENYNSGGRGNYAAGSSLASALKGDEREALKVAFLAAMDTGTTQRWQGRQAVGEVYPGAYSLANLKSDPGNRIRTANADLELSPVLETEQGLYVLTRNSNVRRGPSTDYPIVTKLSSGDGVDAVGKVVGEDWMLIATDDVIRGYVYRLLMIKAPGTELELAGGPRRQAILCREFRQKMSRYSTTDEWAGAACKDDDETWRVVPPPADDPYAPVVLTD